MPAYSSLDTNLSKIVSRAEGCIFGQFAGDALGSLVEFESPESILMKYPNGISELKNGGTWGTLAGQPTDDSEMALALVRTLLKHDTYNAQASRQAYQDWLQSGPFDVGSTTSRALLHGEPDPKSQANGSMMRISPLGIFGALYDLEQVADWSRQDAMLTHPNPICVQTSTLYTMAIAHTIHTGCEAQELYDKIKAWAIAMDVDSSVANIINQAIYSPPKDYMIHMGWVLIAFGNALWQLLHAANTEHAVCDTVMRGGDTDTNAAICGALLGAVYGRENIPQQWIDCILNCRPAYGQPGVERPRPQEFWPVEAPLLAHQLVLSGLGKTSQSPNQL
ncbi:MAG: ADP-ribosylglycohydrolase family protein [Magnetococcales bacterium]|nr:ADP-ribosylglycohydrolase family protein [Magnetococcales bacterium]